MPPAEHRLTSGPKGHMLHNGQVFSRDDEWIVYDTRNEDAAIASTGEIGIVNVRTGEVRLLYRCPFQTEYGPGVGAASFSPTTDMVIFIHGVRNSDASRPYHITRRTCVGIDIQRPAHPVFMDARNIQAPFTPGALRGGTHAHSWSGDGQWISFTYNDYVIDALSVPAGNIKDLRTVGIMVPGKVSVPGDDGLENNSGQRFSVVIALVTETPMPGSDDIDKAFDECWIGRDGYWKPDGSHQRKAIAFQGNTRNLQGEPVTEIFVADLPDDVKRAKPGQPLEGTAVTRVNVPSGIVQRRITFTDSGADHTRHWLRTTPDGEWIAFLAKDGRDLVQIFGVSPNGGRIRQLTFNDFSVRGPFNISPDGRWIAYAADNNVMITHMHTSETMYITRISSGEDAPVGAPSWSNNGRMIAYNRYVRENGNRFLQIFLIDVLPEK